MEDFFDSAYGFSAGTYRFPVSGCTHKDNIGSSGIALSAYRYQDEVCCRQECRGRVQVTHHHPSQRSLWQPMAADIQEGSLLEASWLRGVGNSLADILDGGHPKASQDLMLL